MPVDRVLVPILQCSEYSNTAEFTSKSIENLQLTVVITNLRFLVDYSCQDYKFMMGVTGTQVN